MSDNVVSIVQVCASFIHSPEGRADAVSASTGLIASGLGECYLTAGGLDCAEPWVESSDFIYWNPTQDIALLTVRRHVF
jgi:hypothetical protein